MDIKKISKEITAEKNLQEAVPSFLRYYGALQAVHAVMESLIYYYELFGRTEEGGLPRKEEADAWLLDLNRYVSRHLLAKGEDHAEEAAADICRIREGLIDKMEMLTSYADRFLPYEYLLRRQKYIYEKDLQAFSAEEAASKIASVVFTGSSAAVHENLREAVYQLPVRIAKNRFYDMIQQAIFRYIGQGRAVLEEFMERLSDCAGLRLMERTDALYEERLSAFRGIRFQDMQEEAYHAAADALDCVIKELYQETDFYYKLAELTNALYIAALNRPYSGNDGEEQIQKFLPSFRQIQDAFQNKSNGQDLDEVLIFSEMEGRRENDAEHLSQAGMLFEKIEEMQDPLLHAYKKTSAYAALCISRQCNQGSLFVDFRKKRIEGIVDQPYAQKCAEAFLKELSEGMGMQDKSRNRAATANILKLLPIFFAGQKDFMEYARTSFENCGAAERQAGFDLLMESLGEGLGH